MKTVEEIKTAEDEYDQVISEARQKADAILRKAKEQVLKENTKARESATANKNERLKAGSEKIEDEVDKILAKAREEAEIIKKKKVDEKFTTSLVKSILTE